MTCSGLTIRIKTSLEKTFATIMKFTCVRACIYMRMPYMNV